MSKDAFPDQLSLSALGEEVTTRSNFPEEQTSYECAFLRDPGAGVGRQGPKGPAEVQTGLGGQCSCPSVPDTRPAQASSAHSRSQYLRYRSSTRFLFLSPARAANPKCTEQCLGRGHAGVREQAHSPLVFQKADA